jgi:hypothetical protein
MPWTPKQFRYLMSTSSPLTPTQKANDKAEAHSDPSLVHHKKGESVLQRAVRRGKSS